MVATLQTLEERATRRAPTTLAPGVELGHAPSRTAKELIALALRDTLPARFMVTLCAPGGETFTVQSAEWAVPTEIAAARGIVQGILIALAPPAPLAADVTIARNQWAHLMGKHGCCVAGLTFCCGEPSCITTASLRTADPARAAEQIQRLGWQDSAPWGWLCPEHALASEGGVA